MRTWVCDRAVGRCGWLLSADTLITTETRPAAGRVGKFERLPVTQSTPAAGGHNDEDASQRMDGRRRHFDGW